MMPFDPKPLFARVRPILEEAERLSDAGEMTLEAFARLEERYQEALRGAPEYVAGDMWESLALWAPAGYLDAPQRRARQRRSP